MKKIGDIMSEMGFKKDSNEATRKAFLKYLMRTAVGAEQADINHSKHRGCEKSESKQIEQLEFSFLKEDTNKSKAG